MTFVAFILAGSLPLLPYAIELFAHIDLGVSQFQLSIISTLCALFLVGSLRSIFDKSNWLRSGIEMLGVGSIAAGVAYLLGAVIEKMI
jgi:VIT1/CCC1 family predicted Fe2+/Mn2+ transporter